MGATGQVRLRLPSLLGRRGVAGLMPWNVAAVLRPLLVLPLAQPGVALFRGCRKEL